jgi:hypothetical protein
MLQFSAIGTLALVALAMCWCLAVVVFRVSSAGSVGRQLSLLLVVEGTTLISTGYRSVSDRIRARIGLVPDFFSR